jgi:hypothetical protein
MSDGLQSFTLTQLIHEYGDARASETFNGSDGSVTGLRAARDNLRAIEAELARRGFDVGVSCE